MNTEHMIKKITLGLALAATLAWGNSLMANDISYSNLAGTDINFTGGGNFSFSTTPTTVAPSDTQAANFKTGDGLYGSVTGGFTIGTITTVSGTSSANVSGTGTLDIYDASGNLLTADLNWVDVSQHGTGSTLNVFGVVNVSNVSYSGSDADLVSLEDASGVVNTLGFTFTPAVSLSALVTGGQSTSFSGTISTVSSVPDTTSTAFLFALGAFGIVLGTMVQRRKAIRA